MLDSLLAPVASWIVGVISAAGVAGLMAVESACISLPSEVIMPFAGYLASTDRFTSDAGSPKGHSSDPVQAAASRVSCCRARRNPR